MCLTMNSNGTMPTNPKYNQKRTPMRVSDGGDNIFIDLKRITVKSMCCRITTGKHFLYSNQEHDMSCHMSLQKKHEKRYNIQYNNNYCGRTEYTKDADGTVHKITSMVRCEHNLGVEVKMLLDKPRSNDEIIAIAKDFMANYDNLPFYAYVSYAGVAEYLHIFMFDRHYDANYGYKYVKAYPKDHYINKRTGCFCKSTDPEAVLTHRKGEIISEEAVCFSDKVRFYDNNRGTYGGNVEFIRKAKKYLVKALKNTTDAEILNEMSIKRYRIKNFRQSKRDFVREWNNAISVCEEKLNNFLSACRFMDTFMEFPFWKITQFLQQINDCIYKKDMIFRNVNRKNRKFHVELCYTGGEFNDAKLVEREINAFKEAFNQKFEKFTQDFSLAYF